MGRSQRCGEVRPSRIAYLASSARLWKSSLLMTSSPLLETEEGPGDARRTRAAAFSPVITLLRLGVDPAEWCKINQKNDELSLSPM